MNDSSICGMSDNRETDVCPYRGHKTASENAIEGSVPVLCHDRAEKATENGRPIWTSTASRLHSLVRCNAHQDCVGPQKLTIHRLRSNGDSFTPSDPEDRATPIIPVKFPESGLRIPTFHERHEPTQPRILIPPRGSHVRSWAMRGVAPWPHDFDLDRAFSHIVR